MKKGKKNKMSVKLCHRKELQKPTMHKEERGGELWEWNVVSALDV